MPRRSQDDPLGRAIVFAPRDRKPARQSAAPVHFFNNQSTAPSSTQADERRRFAPSAAEGLAGRGRISTPLAGAEIGSAAALCPAEVPTQAGVWDFVCMLPCRRMPRQSSSWHSWHVYLLCQVALYTMRAAYAKTRSTLKIELLSPICHSCYIHGTLVL